MKSKKGKVSNKYSGICIVILAPALIVISTSFVSTASSNDFCFGPGCHSDPDYFINSSMFDNSSHQYLQCIDCHVNVTQYPNSTHGNFTGKLNLPLPASTYNSSDFWLCYGCHKEANIIGIENGYSNSLWSHSVIPGYPLIISNFSTNFINKNTSGHNFGNVPANIHWDHLDLEKIDAGEGPDLIWDSDRDGTFDSKISCTTCHEPHGNTTGQNLTREDLAIQYGTDADGEYGQLASIEYLRPGGDVYCVGCHGVGVKYYRPRQEVLNFTGLHISPVNMTGCIQAGCHFNNDLTVEHIDNRNFTCSTCHHNDDQGVAGSIQQGNKSCFFSCHDSHSGGSHLTHIESARGPAISCPDCHIAYAPVQFTDGEDKSNTTICDECHSPEGVFDGVNDSVIGAKSNWDARVYNTTDETLKPGKEKWCVGCHDDAPANVSGEIAPNKSGDNATYGYYITGHGRISDYTRMSWQDTSASGNPGANRSCGDCHNVTSTHIVSGTNPDGSRLKSGYENGQDNANCNNCHPPGTAATSDPQFYQNSSMYEVSAHSGKNCTECHEVHGATGVYVAMTRGDKEELCLQCHSGQAGHALGVSFGKGGKTYSLECTSCHNIHVLTGMYTLAEPNNSPLTRFSDNMEVWGDGSGEKMDDYAGSGTYRTPNGDNFSGSQLPDYVTFCLDCHGVSQAEFGDHGGIKWDNSEPHGLNSANVPNGGGTCPDWYSCGKASGWDGDECIDDEATCWPVITRGKGDQLWSRGPYNHDERIAGANFVLSCNDCHVTHESGIGSKLRSVVNNGTGSVIWNTMCNNCHYYYSDWHAGMSCGTASCHAANSIHRMGSKTGAGGTRIFNPDLVAYLTFENNLNDAGTWNMHGRWFNTSGTYTTGKLGKAVLLDGDQPIEVGSRNSYWSTDEGRHGTWKYSEMKYTMTLEAWVYPTSTQSGTENHIFSKHTYTDGGYVLLLNKISGTLRAALLTNVNGGETVWNGSDCNGLRGAYSTVPVPINRWTHVAAVFNASLPDRDLTDLSVGRIRIYVDGEDVTTSYPLESQCYAQPDAGEEDMFPYSEMQIKNVSRCYLGSWCASALSIGGVMWGDGARKGLIGRIDEARVWNIAKNPDYFETFDAQAAPRIIQVEGVVDRDWIIVTFNEGVYTNTGQTGSLQPADFNLTDADNSRTVLSVVHTPGNSTANLTLSSPLDNSSDIDVDTLAPQSSAIYDEYDNPAETDAVTITCQQCPTGTVIFSLNESAGSTYARDAEGTLNGTVYGSGTFAGDGYFHGDGSGNYIDFEGNPTCLQTSSAMTLETRIRPTGLEGTDNYIKRILARDSNGNYQMSVWRNNDWDNYSAPDGNASIALWVKVVDNRGGNTWKPVLTDYDACPVVSDHWYQVRAVWNSSKVGGIPGDIYLDDQGTDGTGTSENWAGYINCTDSDQSQLDPVRYLYEGDMISPGDGDFVIGANVNDHANNVFDGKIDWITWKDSADYSGVD